MAASDELTLVIDIGKSNAKLLMMDAAGTVVERHSRPNASVPSPLGYPALDVHGLASWMQTTLCTSVNTRRCGHVIASTHGAALVALADGGLAWEPLDYEFDVRNDADAALTAPPSSQDSFRETLSPDLPAGLNAARQLLWLQGKHPAAWNNTRLLLPYPQYWAWLLSGVACSEVSSLGCHTHLWNPQRSAFSGLAKAEGWATLFARLRSAWEVLGPVRAQVSEAWGLPPSCQVHAGVHDSNACLARYLEHRPLALPQPHKLTLVSSGTWTVLMAPGASPDALVAEKDMLGNVDVTGRLIPTARFMGGREFEAILGGAQPHAASLACLQQLIDSHTYAFPAFSHQGGPFSGTRGYVERQGARLDAASVACMADAQRATLATIYCAQVTAWLISYLWSDQPTGSHKVIIEGPLAHNLIYLQVLQSVLPNSTCYASTDELEGTARGAWMLTRWGKDQTQDELKRVCTNQMAGMREYHDHWLESVKAATS